MSKGKSRKLQWVLIFVLSGLFGFGVSYFSMSNAGKLNFEGISVGFFRLDIIHMLFLLASVGTWAASVRYCLKFNQEEDKEAGEKLLSSSMMLNTFGTYTAIVGSMTLLSQMIIEDLHGKPVLALLIISLLLVLAHIRLQSLLFKVFNRNFPKRVFDTGRPFGAKQAYMDKLDEAEKFIVYKASYRAFNMINNTLYALVFVTFAYSALSSFQLFPFLILLVLFIVNNLAYYQETKKYQ
ncbi:hypothetical protein BBD42_09870 [Paenibacillus sp. BIHB 4019]|uniref:DUF3169 domain-containing protein n=1 Tax=Paenibacillus sp. BIHB 4019 TaxID=1870819 RepID=A0A1B2DGA9_9BACL|nr:DUF3169 family protein [Paenibacillus sp. BIHB 4019]ANY66736.1 hypothetical protein BBD42_09870 [Paenibacillus sp. BIHB 4019]